MLTYSFTDIGSDSLYIYLYKCLKNDIIQGNINPGEHLPSKRSFAKNLGISVITVENAYAQLSAEGFIYSIPKKGFFVSEMDPAFPVTNSDRKPDTYNKSEENVVPEGFAEAGRTPARSHPVVLADFTSNQTEPDSFPFSVWSRLMRQQLGNNQEELMTNPPSGGTPELRAAIAQHLADFHGLSVSPEQIIVGAGTEYLCGLLIQLLGFDKVYGVEDPSYGKTRSIYRAHKVECCSVPMDESGIRFDTLEQRNVDIVHISPSHQYPTGRVMPIGRRYELLGWASRSERRYIIEDDFDSELRLKGQPLPTMQSIDTMGKVIYMNTFTKTLASTIRISYMVLPLRLVNRFYEQLSFYSCTVPNFEQYTLADFMEEGYFEKHINRMRSHYRKKRDVLLNLITSGPLGQKCEILEENAGLHFLLRVNTEKDDASIIQTASESGLRLSALSQYYEKKPHDVQHIFVINYSSVPEEELPKAVNALNNALK